MAVSRAPSTMAQTTINLVQGRRERERERKQRKRAREAFLLVKTNYCCKQHCCRKNQPCHTYDRLKEKKSFEMGAGNDRTIICYKPHHCCLRGSLRTTTETAADLDGTGSKATSVAAAATRACVCVCVPMPKQHTFRGHSTDQKTRNKIQ